MLKMPARFSILVFVALAVGVLAIVVVLNLLSEAPLGPDLSHPVTVEDRLTFDNPPIDYVAVGEDLFGYRAPIENYVPIHVIKRAESISILEWKDDGVFARYFLPLYDEAEELKRALFLERISKDVFYAWGDYEATLSMYEEYLSGKKYILEDAESRGWEIDRVQLMEIFDGSQLVLAESNEGIIGIIINPNPWRSGLILEDSPQYLYDFFENSGRIMEEQELRDMLNLVLE